MVILVHITLYCYTCTCMQEKATPVYVAAANGNVEVLSALIRSGADLNSANVVSIAIVPIVTCCLYYTACCIVIQMLGQVQKCDI